MSNNSELHFSVQHIFLVEFDILVGSVVKEQYPAKCNFPERDITSSCLPDGCHAINNSGEDTTFFILRDNNELLYCYNVYMQKKIANLKRSARVKALAIASKSRYVTLFKPLLSHALERIFQCTEWADDEKIESAPPVQTTTPIVESTEDKIADEYEIVNLENKQQVADTSDTTEQPTSTNEQEETIAAVEQQETAPQEETIAPVADQVPQEKKIKETPLDIIKQLYDTLNNIRLVSNYIRVEQEKIVRRWIARDVDYETIQVKLLDKTFPIRVPLYMTSNEFPGDYNILHLVQRFKEQIILIILALLFEKRIVILGNSGNVCNIALAVNHLLPLVDLVKDNRLHPYVSLSNLDFLQQKGFICAATNALFESKNNWWDLLINLQTNQITVNHGNGTSINNVQYNNAVISRNNTTSNSNSNSSNNNSNNNNNNNNNNSNNNSNNYDPVESMIYNAINVQSIITPLIGDGSQSQQQQLQDYAFKQSEQDVQFLNKILKVAEACLPKVIDHEQNIVITASRATVERAEQVLRSLVREFMWEYYESIVESAEVVNNINAANASNPGISGAIMGWFSSAMGNTSTTPNKVVNRPKYAKSYASMIQSSSSKHKQWRKTQTFLLLKNIKSNMIGKSSITKFIDCKKEFRRLLNEVKLDDMELITMLQTWTKYITTREHLIDFLCQLPLGEDPLYPLASLLFAPSLNVRLLCVALFRRLETFPEGKRAIANMNSYCLMAYNRANASLPKTA